MSNSAVDVLAGKSKEKEQDSDKICDGKTCIPVNKLREGFDYFDKDKSGTVEVNELMSLLKWLDVDNVSQDGLSSKV
jgi:hypothetical protein